MQESKKGKKMKQMYIDLGQESFNKNMHCKNCNFFYLVGDREDEKEHAKYCAAMDEAVHYQFTKSNKANKIYTFDQWADILEFHPCAMKTEKSLKLVAAQMRDDFGFDVATVDADNKTLQLYIYVDNGSILGILLFERIAKSATYVVSNRVAPTDVNVAKIEKIGDDDKSITNVSTLSFSNPVAIPLNFSDNCYEDHGRDKFTLGVRYIWVHKKWRRKGVASSLCDIARRNAEYGSFIKKKSMSFSQPTSGGIDFAFAYTKNSSLLTYG